MGHTQPPIQRVPGPIYLGVKRPGRESHHSQPVPMLRMSGAIPPVPRMVS
jgi:hypothetical protein